MLARTAAASNGAQGGTPYDRGTLPPTSLDGMDQPAPAVARLPSSGTRSQHMLAAGAQETPLLPLPAVGPAAMTRHTTIVGRMLMQSLLRCSQAVCDSGAAGSTNSRAALSAIHGAGAVAVAAGAASAIKGEPGHEGAAPPSATPAGSSGTSLQSQHTLLRVGLWGYSPWRNQRFRLAWEEAESWRGRPVAGSAGGVCETCRACCGCSCSWGCCAGCSSSERPSGACDAAVWDCKTYFCCCCCGVGGGARSGMVARGDETGGRGSVQGGIAPRENAGTSDGHQGLAGLGVAARRRYRRWVEHEDACIRLLVACALGCGAAASASSTAGV